MAKLGRPKGAVWSLFDTHVEAVPPKRLPDLMCKFCGSIIVNAQSRNMLRHAVGCAAMPHEEKKKWTELYDKKERTRSDRLRERTKAVTPTSRHGRQTAARTPSPTITKRLFVVSDTPSRRKLWSTPKKKSRKERKLAIAKAIISGGMSFRVVEDPNFVDMFDDPSEVPSRFEVAGVLLDELYETERSNVLKELASARFVLIVTDGWTSRSSESIINYVLVNPFIKPLFWKSMATGEAAHDGKYISDQILQVIDEIEVALGRKIVRVVVTGNASNMKAAWRALEASGRGLICNGCAAHVVNLLIKDIFKLQYFKWVLERSKTLTTFIKHRHALLDRFRTIQKTLKGKGERRRALSLPVATRWYTCDACIRSVVGNRNVIAATFSDDEFLRRFQRSDDGLQEAKSIIGDEQFWARASMVLKAVKPIDECLAAFESDNCCISMIGHLFMWLDGVFSKPAGQEETKLVETVRTMTSERQIFLFTPSMKAAYLFDPSKPLPSGPNEPISTLSSTVALAQRIGLPGGTTADDVHQQLVVFARMKKNWTDEERSTQTKYSPLDWWSFTDEYPAIQWLAVHVLSIPTSSAASERSWSIHSFIQSHQRNRLSSQRLDKLVFVYTNMGNKKSVDLVLYELCPESEEFIENRNGEVDLLDDLEPQTSADDDAPLPSPTPPTCQLFTV